MCTRQNERSGYAGRESYDQTLDSLGWIYGEYPFDPYPSTFNGWIYGEGYMIQGCLHWGWVYKYPDTKLVRWGHDHAMGGRFNRKGCMYTLAYIQPLGLNTGQPVNFRVNGV